MTTLSKMPKIKLSVLTLTAPLPYFPNSENSNYILLNAHTITTMSSLTFVFLLLMIKYNFFKVKSKYKMNVKDLNKENSKMYLWAY